MLKGLSLRRSAVSVPNPFFGAFSRPSNVAYLRHTSNTPIGIQNIQVRHASRNARTARYATKTVRMATEVQRRRRAPVKASAGTKLQIRRTTVDARSGARVRTRRVARDNTHRLRALKLRRVRVPHLQKDRACIEAREPWIGRQLRERALIKGQIPETNRILIPGVLNKAKILWKEYLSRKKTRTEARQHWITRRSREADSVMDTPNGTEFVLSKVEDSIMQTSADTGSMTPNEGGSSIEKSVDIDSGVPRPGISGTRDDKDSSIARKISPGQECDIDSHASTTSRPALKPKQRARQKAHKNTAQPGRKKAFKTRATPSKLTFELNGASMTQQKLPLDTSKIPKLHHGLDRVLFNSGVFELRDDRSGVYNFDPYLEDVMPVNEFNFDALPPFVSSSKDQRVVALARKHKKKYSCSTSSISGVLGLLHRVVSAERTIDFREISRSWEPPNKATIFYKSPTSILLRWQDGRYYIEAESVYSSENVLSRLGHPFERLMTQSVEDFERYRKSGGRKFVENERNSPSTYQFSIMGDLLIRSQLDAYDPRLPGSGVFDLKSRAVNPIRLDSANFSDYTDYCLHERTGEWHSFEREYVDMARSTLVKYMFQARLGGMDGIFVAYHNTARIFGFQYLGLNEIDRLLHHDRSGRTGEASFKYCVALVQAAFERATKKYPEQSLRLHFHQNPHDTSNSSRTMHIFAEPFSEERLEAVREAKTRQESEYNKVLFASAENNNDNEEYKKKRSEELRKLRNSESETLAQIYKHNGEVAGWELRVENLANGVPIMRPKAHEAPSWTLRYGFQELENTSRWFGGYMQKREKASSSEASPYLQRLLIEKTEKSRELTLKKAFLPARSSNPAVAYESPETKQAKRRGIGLSTIAQLLKM